MRARASLRDLMQLCGNTRLRCPRKQITGRLIYAIKYTQYLILAFVYIRRSCQQFYLRGFQSVRIFHVSYSNLIKDFNRKNLIMYQLQSVFTILLQIDENYFN